MKVTSISVTLEEKVGLPAYSNVLYRASITADVAEGEDPHEAIREAEGVVEGWMKDYYRREVQEMVQAAARQK